MPSRFIDQFWFCCKSPYVARKHNLLVRGAPGTQMPTGVVVTTVCNTMSTIAMLIKIVVERRSDVEEVGRELGFTVKVQFHEELGSATFLKGWWRRDLQGRPTWLPLPSACLKIGKILRNPVELVHLPGQQVTADFATRVIAGHLASSYGQVPGDYPVFGPFLEALIRNSTPGVLKNNVAESWKPKARKVPREIQRDEAVLAICHRYDLQPEEITRVEVLLAWVVSLPAYVEHRVFQRLRVVDYE